VGERWVRAHAHVLGIASLPVARDVYRELPEDEALDLGEIPGPGLTPESSASFGLCGTQGTQ
jgi:hypothetical protein